MAGYPRLVSETKVSALLTVSERTLGEWHNQHTLRFSCRFGGTPHYNVADINKFLAKGARNFEAPPTLDDLRAGNLVLLQAPEAAKFAKSNRYALARKVAKGRLAAVRASGAWLYSRQSIEADEAAVHAARADVFDRTTVSHVLGVGDTTIGQYVQSGLLEAVKREEFGSERPIACDSLLRLLTKLLPGWVRAEDWLEDRLDSDASLLHATQVLEMLQVANIRTLQPEIDSHRLRYITRSIGGMGKLFLPESVWGLIEDEPLVTPTIAAAVLGMSQSASSRWLNGPCACPIAEHPHDGNDLNRLCLLALLRGMLSPGIRPTTWYLRRMRSGAPLQTVPQIMQACGLSEYKVRAMLAAGELKGVRMPPAGYWRIDPDL